MPGALGPRFLIEASFIIAVAVVAGVERFRTLTIVIMMAAAWLAVATVELALVQRRRGRLPSALTHRERAPVAEPPVEPQVTIRPSPAVRVLRAGAPVVARQPEPEPAPGPDVTPGPRPEPEPETAPEEPPAPEPPPAVPEQPRIAAVAPAPGPVRAPEPVSEAATAVVPLAPRRVEPREWNLWELERIVREQSGTDVARDEERSFLLMYLREFASPDGLLPVDFDAVVRESFGDTLDAIPW